MRLPDGRNRATRQAVHGSAPCARTDVTGRWLEPRRVNYSLVTLPVDQVLAQDGCALGGGLPIVPRTCGNDRVLLPLSVGELTLDFTVHKITAPIALLTCAAR